MTAHYQIPNSSDRRATLGGGRLAPLRLGSISPAGWTAAQTRQQIEGMAGHLDEHWPSLRDNAWIGGSADGWERGPYWLDGVVPLAHLTNDPGLLAKVGRWVEEILARQEHDGWMGPDHGDPDGTTDPVGRDIWPRVVLLKAFLQHHDAKPDPRLPRAMLSLVRALDDVMRSHPLAGWAHYRAFDLALVLQQLHGLTGEDWLIDVGRRAILQAYPWRIFVDEMPTTKVTSDDIQRWREDEGRLLPKSAMITHGVNVAMGMKSMAVEWLYTDDPTLKADFTGLMQTIDQHHGLPNGLFSADEHLAGNHPSQGSETCAVVEQMFSLEIVLHVWGYDEDVVQRLERLAFNALPAAATSDDTAHQYDQQPNQVVCHVTEDRIYSDNGPDSNTFGLEPHFGCCTANRHQGWPKFIANAWLQDLADGSLVALSYVPSRIDHRTEDGATVTIDVSGDYPFSDEIILRISADRPTRQAVKLRIPGWTHKPVIRVGHGGPRAVLPGTLHLIDEEWTDSPTDVVLSTSAKFEVVHNPDNSVTVRRGPLLFVHPIGEKWTPLRDRGWMRDLEVAPVEPWSVALVDGSLSERPSVVIVDTNLSPFHPDSNRLTVAARVRDVTNWPLEHGAAARPPAEAVVTGKERDTTLVPYGVARLRLTAIPLVESRARK